MAESIYPNGIDGYAQLPLTVDGVTRIDAVVVNRLRNAIVKIETELGVKPSGSYIDVRARLDAIEAFPGDLEARVAALESAVDIIETEITTLQGDVGNIQTDLSSNFIIQRVIQLYSVSTISSNTLLDETYGTVLVDASGGNVTVTLPPAGDGTMFYRIKKVDTSDNLVTIAPQVGETIDGENYFEINYGYDSYSITNSSTEWFNV